MDGIFLHDPTTMVAAFRPELFTWKEGAVRVAVDGLAKGKTLLDDGSKRWGAPHEWTGRPKIWRAPPPPPLRPAIRSAASTRRRRVAMELDAPEVLREIMERLSRGPPLAAPATA